MNLIPFDPNRPRVEKPEAAPSTDTLFIRRCRFLEVVSPTHAAGISHLIEHIARTSGSAGLPTEDSGPFVPPPPAPPPPAPPVTHQHAGCPLDDFTGPLEKQQERALRRLARLFKDKNTNAFNGRWSTPQHFADFIRHVCQLTMSQEEAIALIEQLRYDAATGQCRSTQTAEDATAAELAAIAAVAKELPDVERSHLAAIAAAIPAAMQGNTRHLHTALRAFTWHMFGVEDLQRLAAHCMAAMSRWAGNGGQKPTHRRWDRRRQHEPAEAE